MQQQNQDSYDEINLYEIWQIMFKRKVFIIGFFLVGVLLSAVYSFLSPNIYRGYAVFNIVKSDIITTKEIISSKEIVDLLGKIDGEKKVNILPKTYLSVTDLKIAALKNSNNMIMVTIESKNINDITLAISEAHDYLNNIDILKNSTEQNKKMLLQQSAELSELIKSSPDLLVTYHKLFKAGKLSTMGFNPIEISQSVIEIKKQLLKAEHEISKLNRGGMEMAMQPYLYTGPVSPKMLRNIALAGMLSLFIGLCLAFLMEYIGNSKNRQSKPIEIFQLNKPS